MTDHVSNADIDMRTVSRDSAHSTVREHRPDDLDADAGVHGVEILGAPSEAKAEKAPAKKP